MISKHCAVDDDIGFDSTSGSDDFGFDSRTGNVKRTDRDGRDVDDEDDMINRCDDDDDEDEEDDDEIVRRVNR